MLLTKSNQCCMTTFRIDILERVASKDNMPYEENGGIIKT